MELPKFNDTFLPILEVLSDGKMINSRELFKIVEEKYYSHLSKELLDKLTKSGDRLIENRIAWGKSYLKKGGYVHFPQRGFVQITEKGKTTTKENVTLENLQSDSIEFFKPEENKNSKVYTETLSPQEIIDYGFELVDSSVKNELLDKIKSMDPYLFQKVILVLLKKMGYGDFVETQKSRDGGNDGIINEDHLGLKKYIFKLKGIMIIKFEKWI